MFSLGIILDICSLKYNIQNNLTLQGNIYIQIKILINLFQTSNFKMNIQLMLQTVLKKVIKECYNKFNL